MDTIYNSNRILNNNNWVVLRIYRDPTAQNNWKSRLDWYHQILIDVIRPVLAVQPISVIFFGTYGPEHYKVEENEKYEVKLPQERTTDDLEYVKIRLGTKRGKKNHLKNAMVTSISQYRNIVWDYELMTTYDVRGDLGNRYGSQNASQTLHFIRYWDSACRYILSVLTLPHNWINDIDVWGIPHLVNNSLGAYLRCSQYTPHPNRCPNCRSLLYLQAGTNNITLNSAITNLSTPLFLAICPNCTNQTAIISNNI